jgi:glycosyltransferase involved in cell wall biosynthesis
MRRLLRRRPRRGWSALTSVDRPIRVLRIIARMNVGGPAHHVSILGGRLDRRGYETLLVAGRVGTGEGSAQDLARRRGARLETLEHLTPEIRPIADVRALLSLLAVVRSFRPDIVHTHTAKAGFLGRLAAVLAMRPRPKVIHTYHGHVLEGYFGRTKTEFYKALERAAARMSDVLIGVSQSTVDDLVRLGVAPAARFRVVPLGLELEAFLELEAAPDLAAPLRRDCGARAGDVVAVLVGRLVPIKRVDVALEAVAASRAAGAPLRLIIVGDGELRQQLEARAERLGLGPYVHFTGFREDMAQVVAAADIALMTSDNEGTPVALIEAAAGARPAVATDVGGVATVVPDGAGRRCPRGDAAGLGLALAELAGDAELRQSCGRAARAHVAPRFGAERLVGDVDALYRSLLRGKEPT